MAGWVLYFVHLWWCKIIFRVNVSRSFYSIIYFSNMYVSKSLILYLQVCKIIDVACKTQYHNIMICTCTCGWLGYLYIVVYLFHRHRYTGPPLVSVCRYVCVCLCVCLCVCVRAQVYMCMWMYAYMCKFLCDWQATIYNIISSSSNLIRHFLIVKGCSLVI